MVAEYLRKHRMAVFIAFALFAVLGVARCIYNTMLVEFSKSFGLDIGKVMLIQCGYSLLYFVFAIPATLYARALGSKAAVVFGLGSWSVGAFLFYPAGQQHIFVFFLFAALVMSLGFIFVEVTLTPLVVRMGRPERMPFRLNLAHAFDPVGVLATLLVLNWLKLTGLTLPIHGPASAILRPYMVIGATVLLFAFVTDNSRFPPFATERGNLQGVTEEFRSLLRRPLFLAAIAAQFCAMTATIGTWSFGYWYIFAALPGTPAEVMGTLLMVGLALFIVGRFAGAFLILRTSAELLVSLFALSGVVLSAVAVFAHGWTGVYAMIAANLSMSILFATILAIALRDVGPLVRTGTALVYIGGSASAISIGAMYLLAMAVGVKLIMLVPMLGFAGVFAFALFARRHGMAPPAAAQAAE